MTEKIITADEFWASHAPKFLSSQKPVTSSQEKGVSSGFLVNWYSILNLF